MSPPTVAGLAEMLGRERVDDSLAERRRWSVNGAVPGAVAFPRDVEELAEILSWASREGSAVVPAGRGTWIEGGGPVDAVDVVLSTRRMGRVLEYEPGDLTLTAQAGLRLTELQRRTGESGQWLPQDPPGWRGSTLGAFLATGLPGPLAAGFGRPRDLVLGLTVVTGDGRIVRPGGRVVKNVAGFDLVRLLVGSWGSLGVIGSATVRLFPRPERDVTLVFGADDTGELAQLARDLATAPVVPDGLELADPVGVSDTAGTTVPGKAAVFARLLGSRAAVEEKKRILAEAAGRQPHGIAGEAGGENRDPAEPRGGGREDRKESAGWLSLRLALLPDRLDELLRAAGELGSAAREEGRTMTLAGHPTLGVLRVEIGRSERIGSSPDRWVDLLRRLRVRLEEGGGSLAIVRAPVALGRAVGARGDAGAVGRLLGGLKDEFDPSAVLVPGRHASGGGA